MCTVTQSWQMTMKGAQHSEENGETTKSSPRNWCLPNFQSSLTKMRHCLIIMWQFIYLTPVSKGFGHLVMAVNKVLIAFNLHWSEYAPKLDMLINSARYAVHNFVYLR